MDAQAEGGADAGLDAAAEAASEAGNDAATEAGNDAATEAGGDDSGEDAQSDAAPVDAANDVADGPVCSSPYDAASNRMQAQPAPSNWDDSFGGTAHNQMTAVTLCGLPGIHWVQSGVGAGQWIKIYLQQAPYNSNLQPGSAYTASIALMGTGAYHLDVWDGNGGAGAGDNQTPSQTLSPTQPTVFTRTFTEGTGTDPQIQVRVDANTATTNVDLYVWDIAVY
jgi:hypothetical protein